MYNPILEKRKELIDNIQKSFESTEDGIEKAKWQIGEVRVDSRGIAHECYEYTSDGKPRLRRVKKQKSDNSGKKVYKEEYPNTPEGREQKMRDIMNEAGERIKKKLKEKEDLDAVGEFKNGFKFKDNTEYTLRYNKFEKKYEVFENKTYRGAGKVPMWELKSDSDKNIGDKVLKVLQKKFHKNGSTISFEGKIHSL